MKISQSEESSNDRYSTPKTRDQVEYMADLILELRDMARNSGLETLAGLLELANAEARLRAKDVR